MKKHLIAMVFGLALTQMAGPAVAAPQLQIDEGEIYIVQENDWLSKLAEKYYADLNAYPAIVAATNARAKRDSSFTVILDPDRIEIGQKLYIPAQPDLDAEQDHILSQVAKLPAPADTLAFSPDDTLLALGNFQNSVQVWQTETWSVLWQAKHDGIVRKVVFSPDGRLLASAGFDGTVRVRDAQTGEEMSRLTFDYWVYGLEFSADGQFLAAGSLDGKSLLVDAATGQPVVEFKHDFPVHHLALSPNAPWLAILTSGKWGPVELAVWDIFTEENRVLAQTDGPPSFSNVVFSPDAQWLAASIRVNQPIRIWETLIWPEAVQLEKPSGQVHQLAFSPDGEWLAARMSGDGDVRGTVWVWRVSDWQLVSTMDQPDVTFAMAFNPDSQLLAIGLGQGIEYEPTYEAHLWDVAGGQRIGRMPHDHQVLALAFSHDGRWIATGSPDGTTRLWDVPTGQ